jgi:hypothetical protein
MNKEDKTSTQQVCAYCNLSFASGALLRVGDADICLTCLGNYYRVCDGCGKFVAVNKRTIIDSREYCSDCASLFERTCEHCGNKFYARDTSRLKVLDDDDSEHLWCPECIDDASRVCSSCGNRYGQENTLYVDEVYLCNCCYESQVSICHYCGEPHLESRCSDVHTSWRSSHSSICTCCSDCLSDNTFTCEHCDKVYDSRDRKSVV